MRKFVAFLVLFYAMAVTPAFAQQAEQATKDKVKKAQDAAQLWLASADAGSYDKTWDDAAALFQQAVTKADWKTAVTTVRAPLGNLKNRSVSSATFAENLPGAPKGEYVVIEYASEYAQRGKVVETVTPMLAQDGTWKVAGYYVK